MNNTLTKKEREHLGRIKSLVCSVCGAPPPSDAHHIKQGQQYTTVALCRDCHMNIGGPVWRVYKMDELSALNVTLKNLIENAENSC